MYYQLDMGKIGFTRARRAFRFYLAICLLDYNKVVIAIEDQMHGKIAVSCE